MNLQEINVMEEQTEYKVDQPLDSYSNHEALDRVHCIMIMIEELLSKHPYFKQNKKEKYFIELAEEHLARAYQMIGEGHLR